jgi:hypothetical protein
MKEKRLQHGGKALLRNFTKTKNILIEGIPIIGKFKSEEVT